MADGSIKSRFCNIDVMGEVKRLRQENLRLKDQIQALSITSILQNLLHAAVRHDTPPPPLQEGRRVGLFDVI